MTRGLLRFVRRNAVAMLALFIALTGTTYAASTALIGKNTVASPQVVNGSLQTKDLSAGARKALKGNRGLPGLAGARGATGAQGVQGAQGVPGVAGAAGTAVAYAHISDTGVVDAANSKGIAASQVTHTSGSFYCIDALSFTPHAVVATSDGFGPSNGFIANPTIISCGGTGNQVRVYMTNASAPTTAVDHAFYIWFE